jgi:hypothetical protein
LHRGLLELSLANFTQDLPLPEVAIRRFIYKSRKPLFEEMKKKSIFPLRSVPC